jgi:tetratricopeptide (TPR) repeat protein
MSVADKCCYPDLKTLKRYAKMLPNHIGILLEIGRYYTRNYAYRSAISYFEKVEIIVPTDSENLLELAEAYYHEDSYGKAHEYYLKAEPYHTYTEYVLERAAWSCQKAGNYEQAIRLYHIWERLTPSNANMYVNLGYCYGKIENSEKALEYSFRAKALSPMDKTALLNIGFRYWVMKDLHNARKYTELSLKSLPDYDYALMNMGHIYWCEGDKIKAMEYYQKSIKSFRNINQFDLLMEDDAKYIPQFGITLEEYDQVRTTLREFGKDFEENEIPF